MINVELSRLQHQEDWRTRNDDLIVRCQLSVVDSAVRSFSAEVEMLVESRLSIRPRAIRYSRELPSWVDRFALRQAVELYYFESVWNLVPPRGESLVGFVFPTAGAIGMSRATDYRVEDGRWIPVTSRVMKRAGTRDRAIGVDAAFRKAPGAWNRFWMEHRG